MRLLIVSILFLVIQNAFSQSVNESFEGYIGRDNSVDAENFFNFMMTNNNKIVYLKIFLDDDQDVDISKEDYDFGRIIFTATYKDKDGFNAGAEYLIHCTKVNKNYFDYNKVAKRLDGYFKIWNISGPHQGVYSINLRPIYIK